MEILQFFSFESLWNIWFWAAVVISWSVTCHFILGVPFDLVVMADRKGGQWADHCDAMAQAQIFRMTQAFESYGMASTCSAFFGLAAIGTMAFFLDLEAAQALFALLAPQALVHGWSVPIAFRLRRMEAEGVVLRKALAKRRFWHQVAGLVAIALVTTVAVYDLAKDIKPF